MKTMKTVAAAMLLGTLTCGTALAGTDTKVALVPGVAFGADKYARLSYAISMENIKKGMDRIEEAIKNLK